MPTIPTGQLRVSFTARFQLTRVVSTIAVVFAGPTAARAEILPSFSDGRCETEASHVVVVDRTGKVLESCRGDLKPGDVLPLSEFRLKLEQPVGRFGMKEGGPDRVTGDRLVLFLLKNGPKYDRGLVVGSWAAGHWIGDFDVSALWVEGGDAYGREQWINPGPQEMTRLGTEAEFKKRVADVNAAVAGVFARARAEKNLAERAKLLAGIVTQYPGFFAEAFAALEWCGADALPALRSILKKDLIGDPVAVAVYSTMAKVGEPARGDLMKHLERQLASWKDVAQKVEWANKIDGQEVRDYRLLLAATSNPEVFQNPTAAQQKSLRELRDLWATHPVLSKLGEKGDRIADRSTASSRGNNNL